MCDFRSMRYIVMSMHTSHSYGTRRRAASRVVKDSVHDPSAGIAAAAVMKTLRLGLQCLRPVEQIYRRGALFHDVDPA